VTHSVERDFGFSFASKLLKLAVFVRKQKWLEQKNTFEKELENLEHGLNDYENEGLQHFLQDDMQHTRKVLAIIDRAIDLRASPTCVARIMKAEQA
jgi:hypothetical protein